MQPQIFPTFVFFVVFPLFLSSGFNYFDIFWHLSFSVLRLYSNAMVMQLCPWQPKTSTTIPESWTFSGILLFLSVTIISFMALVVLHGIEWMIKGCFQLLACFTGTLFRRSKHWSENV